MAFKINLSTKDGKNPIQFSKPAEVIFGGIKSILTPEQGQVFENNIAQFVSNFVGINESKMTDSEKEQVLLSEDIEAIQIALDREGPSIGAYLDDTSYDEWVADHLTEFPNLGKNEKPEVEEN